MAYLLSAKYWECLRTKKKNQMILVLGKPESDLERKGIGKWCQHF